MIFYMAIGVPGSGKSTYRKEIASPKMAFISTDDYVDRQAARLGKTYKEVWKDHYDDALKAMNGDLDDAVRLRKDIFWDQTNLDVTSRAKKLKRIPEFYRKIAVVFNAPIEVLLERNDKRAEVGRDIPVAEIMKMKSRYEFPTWAEGFNEIRCIRSW